MNLDYRILDNLTNTSSFCCGNSEDHEKLNQFLKNRAIGHQDQFISTTTIVFDKDSNNRIVGYINLLADKIQVEEQQKTNFFKFVQIKDKYDAYPAIKIGRIAIDQDYQDMDIGKNLFKLAIAFAVHLNRELGIGVRFIVVDTKNMAKTWYLEKLNFRVYDEKNPNFLYYDVKGWKDAK